MIGNEHTGDITKLAEYLDTIVRNNDNWIKGTKGKFKICAKIFPDDSGYGINCGRISKIQICDVAQEHWGFDQCYLNYDRGWDISPDTNEVVVFMNGLLEALGNEPLNPDDLDQTIIPMFQKAVANNVREKVKAKRKK